MPINLDIDKFSDAFFVKSGMTLMTKIIILNDLLNSRHRKYKNEYNDYLGAKRIKNLIHFRNVLAHSMFIYDSDEMNEDDFRLQWIGASHYFIERAKEIKEENSNADKVIISYSEIQDMLNRLSETSNIIREIALKIKPIE